MVEFTWQELRTDVDEFVLRYKSIPESNVSMRGRIDRRLEEFIIYLKLGDSRTKYWKSYYEINKQRK